MREYRKWLQWTLSKIFIFKGNSVTWSHTHFIDDKIKSEKGQMTQRWHDNGSEPFVSCRELELQGEGLRGEGRGEALGHC